MITCIILPLVGHLPVNVDMSSNENVPYYTLCFCGYYSKAATYYCVEQVLFELNQGPVPQTSILQVTVCRLWQSDTYHMGQTKTEAVPLLAGGGQDRRTVTQHTANPFLLLIPKGSVNAGLAD